MVNVHNSHNKSKHIAVIIQAVHGQNKQEWILAIPETRSGTGKAEAEVVIEELKQHMNIFHNLDMSNNQ